MRNTLSQQIRLWQESLWSILLYSQFQWHFAPSRSKSENVNLVSKIHSYIPFPWHTLSSLLVMYCLSILVSQSPWQLLRNISMLDLLLSCFFRESGDWLFGQQAAVESGSDLALKEQSLCRLGVCKYIKTRGRSGIVLLCQPHQQIQLWLCHLMANRTKKLGSCCTCVEMILKTWK